METTLENIEKAISELEQDELNEFRTWFEKFDSKFWDEQIKNDAEKLKGLANASIAEHKAGKSRKF